ncbi:lysozyme [Mucilaginibacter gracilis]|uniref:Lysozyme n=1 Tax=Mucilaginibacter gracilis TaxID=423350 RepID=A0A495J4G0_9SPHI|nr:GH25 family lysozyme [Mucilaginibacter gracilis]RKR83713.1 lysozyme [Mucilaginibacter gracilis]
MNLLQLGSQGSDVQKLQNQLIAQGFQIAADGIFGPGTQAALKQYQQSKGLTADGIAGANTFSALGDSVTTATGIRGIDISHNNGAINWAILATEVSFVYCKASQGNSFKDPMFQQNFHRLAVANIIRGGYHFLNFQNSPADVQVENFLACGIDYSVMNVLPPVLDVEWQVPQALNDYIKPNRTACVQLVADWLSAVELRTGRVPMIYTNPSFWRDFLGNPSGFENYPLWTSGYSNNPPAMIPGWSHYTFWQNSGTGKISSINGDVDTDVFNGEMDDLIRLASPSPQPII